MQAIIGRPDDVHGGGAKSMYVRLRTTMGGILGRRPDGGGRGFGAARAERRVGRTPAALLYLVAFSAVVTYLYDEALFRRSNFRFRDGVAWDESIQNFRPSKEQLSIARQLNLEDRLLAVTKESWPECRAQGMTAWECKDFIDEEILTQFTDMDKHIRTRIVGGRSLEDDWYNAVSIVMDEQNLVLGTDGDGWVRYTFEWDGSGYMATEEQQRAIPPITSQETTSGSQESQQVTTILTPDPTDAFEPIVVVDPVDEFATTTDPTDEAPTQGTTTTRTTTTVTTTTVTTTTSFQVEPEFTLAPPIVEGGLITSAPVQAPPEQVGDTFNYVEPPIVPEEEPVLVEGSSTDGAITGDETAPINGGVVISDNNLTPGGTGEILLQQALDTPPVIEPAGMRTIGPFNCKEMTGYQCCLMIKHLIRDQDTNGRAIQCHLRYHDLTCKNEWLLEAEPSKKVLIHTNENWAVLQDPVIEGSWPSCDDVLTDVHNMADIAGQANSVATDDSGAATDAPVAPPPAPEPPAPEPPAPEPPAPEPPAPPAPEPAPVCAPVTGGYRCGKDYGDIPCCDGYCCSAWGWCGSGATWCDFGCQSQCWAESSTTGLTVTERCGDAAGGRLCHGTYCCSAAGYCGSGDIYCEQSQGCQSGCWPDAGDGSTAVNELPTTIQEECKGNVNVCIAFDTSGSVCSPNFFDPQLCSNCPNDCQQGGHNKDTCCPNFQKIKDFGTSVVNWVNHLQFGNNRRSISLVTFATWGYTAVQMGGNVLQGIENLDYSGGFTNHGEAFDHCQDTFAGQTGQNFILLVTDGVATTADGSHNNAAGKTHGRARATAAKNQGTIVETVFINPQQATSSQMNYMKDLSSSDSYHDIGDFEELGSEVNDVAYKLACSGDPNPASIPPENVVNADAEHCGCLSCTQEAWDTWVGHGDGQPWHTCGQRIEWKQTSAGGNLSYMEACAYVTNEFPLNHQCPCTC